SSDSVWCYEIGAKNLFFNRRFSLSTSAYEIKWRGIQQAIYLVTCNQSLTYNAGEVTSKGFDVQAVAQITPALRLNGSVAYTKATFDKSLLGEPDPVTGVQPIRINAGDSIGTLSWNSPAPWTASAGLDYNFKFAGHDAYGNATYTFTSKHTVPTAAQDPSTVLYEAAERPVPEQALLNLRAGITLGPVETSLF